VAILHLLRLWDAPRRDVPLGGPYRTQTFNLMVSLTSIHPQARQLNFTTRNSKQNVDEFVNEMTLEKPFDGYIV
jgi:hypothetical protein